MAHTAGKAAAANGNAVASATEASSPRARAARTFASEEVHSGVMDAFLDEHQSVRSLPAVEAQHRTPSLGLEQLDEAGQGRVPGSVHGFS